MLDRHVNIKAEIEPRDKKNKNAFRTAHLSFCLSDDPAANPGLDLENVTCSGVQRYRKIGPQDNANIRYIDIEFDSRAAGTSCCGLDLLDPQLYDDYTIRTARRLWEIADKDAHVIIRISSTLLSDSDSQQKQTRKTLRPNPTPS